MGGSAIAAALAAQEAARNQRRLERDLERRRVMRKHRVVVEHDAVPEHHSMPCALQCLGCGFLAIAPDGGDPMREDAEAWRSLPCRGCGARSWVDLADVQAAEALREFERRELGLSRGVVASSFAALGLGGIIALAIGGFVAATLDPIMTAAMVFGGLAGEIHCGRRIAAALGVPARRAWRWHAPARVFSIGDRIAAGAVAGDAELTAPISGRPAVAWRVEVRYPTDRAGEFALVEQHSAAQAVGDTPLVDEPTIATHGTPVTASTELASRYLVSRGLDPNEILEIVERVVSAGDQVELRSEADGGPPILCDPPGALARARRDRSPASR